MKTERYPTKAEITRVVEVARELNILVGGLEVGRDGTIRILPPAPAKPSSGNAFDDWVNQQQGG